jgi:hypothetical protein
MISTLELKSGFRTPPITRNHQHKFRTWWVDKGRDIAVCIHCQATRSEIEEGYVWGK